MKDSEELTSLDAPLPYAPPACPPLSETHAARVRAYARSEFVSASTDGQWVHRFRSIHWNGALVPALLMSAVLSFTAQTARTVAAVYAGHGQSAVFGPANP
jgi:hypothetical protein